MDWAEEKYDVCFTLFSEVSDVMVLQQQLFIFCLSVMQKLLIAQIKMVLKVLFLYIPLPMFWTLFDQKVS